MTRCKECSGAGKVPQVFAGSVVMGYVGPNGENWPMEICRGCGGTGWQLGTYQYETIPNLTIHRINRKDNHDHI